MEKIRFLKGKKKPMLIIFDFDGVLYKASWIGLFEAYKEIIKSQEKNHKDFFGNLEEFKKWWSPDWRKNNKKLGINRKDSEGTRHIFYEVYNSYCFLFPWINEVLEELRHKHQLALFTNRHRENTEKILGSLKILFSFIIGGEDVKKLKPNSEGIKIILERTHACLEGTLMVGDMPDDIAAGKAAGVKTGVVKWGLGDWDKLRNCSPDYEFIKYKQLLRI